MRPRAGYRRSRKRDEFYFIPLSLAMLCLSIFFFAQAEAESGWKAVLNAGTVLLTTCAVSAFHYFSKIDKKKQYLVFCFYLLVICSNLPMKDLLFGLLPTLCFIGALVPLFQSFHLQRCERNLFLSGIFVGVCGLFFGMFLWYAPLFLLGMYVLWCLSPHGTLAYMFGLAMPLWGGVGVCFYLDDWTFLRESFGSFFAIELQSIQNLSPQEMLLASSSLLLFFFIGINLFMRFSMEAFRQRSYLLFMLIAAVYSALLAVFFAPYTLQFFLVGMVPFSFLLVYFLCSLGRR